MAIAGVGGVSGAGGLSRLAELYRQQVVGNTRTAEATAATGGTAAAGQTQAVQGVQGTRGDDFASAIGDGLRAVENLDRTASTKAVQAATGDLTDVHDYVIAATQAQVATELTTTVRNKALEAFNDIMRMQL
jgi:flagellar hook-basal body complex protein FliE